MLRNKIVVPVETSAISVVLQKYYSELLEDWLKEQINALSKRRELIRERELREHSALFLTQLKEATQSGNLTDVYASEWGEVRATLSQLSKTRAESGFSPSETATFIFSFKQPLFSRLRTEFEATPGLFADNIWIATLLLDQLGLFTTEVFQKSREEVINRQQQEMMELSTPVVKLWDGILALPMIGTLDSSRTQVVMETLLQRIVETGSEIAIIDITGVPAVDTLVAQHLLKTVTAARLMGAECIISGIRPQIAATIVHLGVNLGDVATKATLADAFYLALQRTGRKIADRNTIYEAKAS